MTLLRTDTPLSRGLSPAPRSHLRGPHAGRERLPRWLCSVRRFARPAAVLSRATRHHPVSRSSVHGPSRFRS